MMRILLGLLGGLLLLSACEQEDNPVFVRIIYTAPAPPLDPGYHTYEVGLSSGDTTGFYEYR